jgi:hypothetical protein
MTFPAEESMRVILKANHWLAIKRQKGIAAIKSEVEQWDVTALTHRLQLARAALLDDLEATADLVEELIAREELSSDELKEWPILEEPRGHERYPHLLELAEVDEVDDETESGEEPSGASKD